MIDIENTSNVEGPNYLEKIIAYECDGNILS